MSVSDEFAAAFEQYWSSETITSLRQIQALYGAISEASEGGDSVVPEEYQLYVTPGELDSFTTEADEDNRLVTVRVDLTGDNPRLDGVDVRPLRPELVDRLGFSRFPWGRGIDHSITRRGAKGGSSRDTVATYCQDCLERWTDADDREPAIGNVAADHPDGWVIRALQTLGSREDSEEILEKHLWPLLGANEKPRVVATVAVAVDPENLEQTPTGTAQEGYYYPGQLPVLNEGMKARNEEKMARKNIPDSSPPSRGDGTCLVTGADTEVFGTTEGPLALFTVQHTEKFPELKKEHSWRTHPVSSPAALLIQSGTSLVEQCRRTRRGRSVYTIPYFTRIDADRAALLRYALTDLPDNAEVSMPKVQEALEAECDEAALAAIRYYVVALRNDSGDINVLHEVPDATVMPVRRIAEAHLSVLDGTTFDAVAGFNNPDDWQPITDNTDPKDVIRSVTSGLYAFGTLARSDEDNPSTDDPSEWLTFSLLTGDPVPVQRLLSEYVARLAQERADDTDNRLSENHLKAQYAQLEALARAGQLLAPNNPELSNPPQMTDDIDVPPAEQFLTDEGTLPIDPIRAYRLERFLDERPAFTDDSRRAAFLAGVLVGQLGSYQSNPKKRDMNRTVLQQYPAEQISGERIARFVPELTDKANVYAADDDDFSGRSLFPELEDRLPAALSDAAAAGWTIPVEDLRFHYALGQLYGKRSLSRAFDLRARIVQQSEIDLEQNHDVTDTQ